MQAKTLKQPGHFSNAERIRRDVAHAISRVECAKASGAPGEGAMLSAFLLDAGAKTPDAVAPTLPATQAIVSNAGTVNVENSAGNLDSTGTLTVAANAVTNVRLASTKTIVTSADTLVVTDASGGPAVNATATVAAGVLSALALSTATDCIVQEGLSVVVQNSANVGVSGAHVLHVAAGAVSKINLSATIGTVANGVKQSGWTVTGSGTFFTPTVANGVCTGGVLSAS